MIGSKLARKMRFPRLDLDLRSLAAFRILFGIFLFLDTVLARLALGRYDIAWYTSDDNVGYDEETIAYLSASDTPHNSPLHRLWFYRGSARTQYAIFALTAAVSLAFCVGFHCHGVLKTALWVLITAQQNRNMHVRRTSLMLSSNNRAGAAPSLYHLPKVSRKLLTTVFVSISCPRCTTAVTRWPDTCCSGPAFCHWPSAGVSMRLRKHGAAAKRRNSNNNYNLPKPRQSSSRHWQRGRLSFRLH